MKRTPDQNTTLQFCLRLLGGLNCCNAGVRPFSFAHRAAAISGASLMANKFGADCDDTAEIYRAALKLRTEENVAKYRSNHE